MTIMPTCPPFDRAVIKSRLEAAEIAYHNLITGGQARVIVDQNGERVEFTPTSAGRLMAYIQELRRLLGYGGTSPGPMMAVF